MGSTERQRLLLATIAANGILAHNSAVSMPQKYSEDQIAKLLGIQQLDDDLRGDLDTLVKQGLLVKRNTGHSGYGNSWISGSDVWSVLPAGLVALWTAEN